jgi:hypothetical protein
MARIMIVLLESDKKALFTLAEREFREPRDQAALIIHKYLERRGLLHAEQENVFKHDLVAGKETT